MMATNFLVFHLGTPFCLVLLEEPSEEAPDSHTLFQHILDILNQFFMVERGSCHIIKGAFE